jgi:hypothetical protein
MHQTTLVAPSVTTKNLGINSMMGACGQLALQLELIVKIHLAFQLELIRCSELDCRVS